MLSFIHSLLDPIALIKFAGLVGVILIVFAESGLFFGFFFPGDSLLFTAGFLAQQGIFSFLGLPTPIVTLILFLGVFIAAVAGDTIGYVFGARVGLSIFVKDNSFFFNKKYPARAQRFYEVHGKKTIILARFIPIIRTFAPIVAGVGHMKYSTFLAYNIIGGALWTLLITGAGYILGASVPHADKYVSLIVAIIIVVSVIPAIVHFIKEKNKDI